MAYIYDLADVWASSGTTFTAIKMNVTDTASAAASLLMDLQVGGGTRFRVDKNGSVFAQNSTDTGGLFSAGSNGFKVLQIGGATLGSNGFMAVRDAGVAVVRGSGSFSWENGGNNPATGTIDLTLARDAANTLAQRNGVNAQAFNLYNTYTDASNYERGYMRWSSNLLDIGMEAAGTGSAGRIIRFVNTTEIFRLSSTVAEFKRPIYMGGATSGTIDFIEQSSPPSGQANLAKIFAEDNGSGKTRLMVQFGSGAAIQIAIEP